MNKEDKLIALISFLLLLYTSKLIAQNNITLNFNHITEKEGLNNLVNQNIEIDKIGRVWVTSWDGIFCFDGIRLHAYKSTSLAPNQMSNSIVSGLVKDMNGNLWFGTETLCKYDILKNTFRSNFVTIIGSRYLTDYVAPFYCDSNNHIWAYVGRYNTICRYDPICNEYHPQTIPIQSEAKVLKKEFAVVDTFWTFRENKLLTRFTIDIYGKWTQQFLFDGKTNNIKLNKISDVEKINGLIYISCNEGLVEYNETTNKYKIYNSFNSIQYDNFTAIEFYENQIFVGTRKSGLLLFDLQLKKFIKQWEHQVDQIESLASNNILEIKIEPTGILWITMVNKGIDYCRIVKSNFQTSADLKAQQIWTSEILEDKNNKIWYNTFSDGIYTYDPINKTLNKPRYLNKLSNSQNTTLNYGKNNNITILSQNKIFQVNPKLNTIHEKTIFNTKPPTQNLFLSSKILNDNNQYIWTENKLFKLLETKYNYKSLEIIQDENSPLTYPNFVFQFQDGTLFCPNTLTSFFKINNDSLKIIKNLSGYKGGIVDIKKWKQNKYILMGRESLSLLIYPELKIKEIQTNQKINNRIKYQSIEIDNKFNLWIGTNDGLLKIDTNYNTMQFNMIDGLVSKNFSTKSALACSNGCLIFGTNKGLIYFNPDSISKQILKPSIYIDKILANEKTIVDSGNHNFLKIIELPYHLNSISIKATTIEYQNPTKNIIQYKLDPYDNQWTTLSNSELIRYPRLPVGKYKLSIIGQDETEKFKSNTKTIEITILPPWYLSWWFKLILLGLITYAIWWLFNLRTQKLLEKQKIEIEKLHLIENERKRISRDMHDDLGSGLSALHLLVNYLKETYSNESIGLKDDMSKISTLVKYLNQSIREIIWTNSSKDDSLESLIHFLKKYVHGINEQSSIKIYFKSSEISSNHSLSSDERKNIFLSAKEALNNALKYSNTKEINISFTELTENNYCITIQDFGIGIKAEQLEKHSGNGLQNMETRMNLINGKCIIDSSKNGTSVKLYFSPK
jgi:signal transduction histidine kinase/ligand-binding sensor domain-containing protein